MVLTSVCEVILHLIGCDKHTKDKLKCPHFWILAVGTGHFLITLSLFLKVGLGAYPFTWK